MSNPKYKLTLHKTYYDKGFFNLGVDVDRHVRKASGPATLMLGSSKSTYSVKVNREANLNGTPRIMGGNSVRDWIQRNFTLKDAVTVGIISLDKLWLY
ncbi:MAG: hypothetical protein JKY88_17765 [Pseudomonadales bacterium]|nr:hypothetical protein [Pseudomonadales bacterium]